ncbi:MAG: GGDEF domain-containing protein, partial [Wenzhouxiangella sp.]
MNPTRAVRAEINRQNWVRQRNFTLVALPILLYLLVNEIRHARTSATDLSAHFGTVALDPGFFNVVVLFRVVTIIALVLFGVWSWCLRRRTAALRWPTQLFILVIGALLSATAILALKISLSIDIFLLGLFVFCALFFMPAWLAWTFCIGCTSIYVGGALWLIEIEQPSFRHGLIVNSTIMAALGLVVCLQNYRSKHSELIALQLLNQDNRNLVAANEAIELSSNLDSLTGLFNRGALETDLAAMAANNDHFALGMIDIDYFKPYNDNYGHQMGDTALKRVARALVDSLNRSGDRVYRYGGEEFVVLLPHTPLEGAVITLEKLRSAVEAIALTHPGRPDGNVHVTISAGIAHS